MGRVLESARFAKYSGWQSIPPVPLPWKDLFLLPAEGAVMRWPLVLCFAFAALVLPARPAAADDLFPDKNLEAVVRQYVFEKRTKSDPLVEADVVNISTIVGKGKKIANLQGLEKCKALALLDLENNEISDISAIKDLKLIQSLTLAKNKIKDIGPLGGLTGIQYLEISNNEVADLAPLANVKALTNLYASHNQIKDLAPLANLPKLISLYLDGNPIENFQPLATLPKLERLDLRGTGISDLSPLAAHTEWTYLFLNNNKITDLSVLVAAAKKDFEGQKRFAPFWYLYIGDNPLSDAAKTTQLDELKKYGTRVHMTYP
jgi:internalin A